MNDVVFDPRTMLEAVRIMKPKTTFFRTFFMRNVRQSPVKTVQADFKRGGASLAPIVNEIIGGKTTALPGYTSNVLPTPLVAPDKVFTSSDLAVRLPGENPYGGATSQDRDAALVAEALQEMDGELIRREEWMCAVAMVTGKIVYKSEDTKYQVDFNFKNIVTLTDKFWADADGDPLGDIENWQNNNILKYGYQKGDTLVGAVDAINAFLNNASVKDILKSFQGQSIINMAPRIIAPGITFVCSIPTLGVDVYKYAETYKDDVTGNVLPYIPNGQVVLLSSGANYEMAYGAVDIADEENNIIRTVQAARVPDSWVEKRPTRRIVNLSSRPLPIPREVDSWVSAKVLA
jgi:Phage major capsid protein E.